MLHEDDFADEMPKPEKVERGNGENDRPHKGNTYYEGTGDDNNQANTPDSEESPDHQEVGNIDDPDDDDEREHIET